MNQMIIALMILLITVLLFILEPVPLVVIAVSASLLYAFFGLIEQKEIFASYTTRLY